MRASDTKRARRSPSKARRKEEQRPPRWRRPRLRAGDRVVLETLERLLERGIDVESAICDSTYLRAYDRVVHLIHDRGAL